MKRVDAHRAAAVVGVDEFDVPIAVVVPLDLDEDPHRLGLLDGRDHLRQRQAVVGRKPLREGGSGGEQRGGGQQESGRHGISALGAAGIAAVQPSGCRDRMAGRHRRREPVSCRRDGMRSIRLISSRAVVGAGRRCATTPSLSISTRPKPRGLQRAGAAGRSPRGRCRSGSPRRAPRARPSRALEHARAAGRSAGRPGVSAKTTSGRATQRSSASVGWAVRRRRRPTGTRSPASCASDRRRRRARGRGWRAARAAWSSPAVKK